MTRFQLRGLAVAAGFLLAMLSFGFATEGLIRWFWGAPLTFAGAVLFAVGIERQRTARRPHYRPHEEYSHGYPAIPNPLPPRPSAPEPPRENAR